MDRDFLGGATGPADFETVDFRCGAKAEMDAHVGAGAVAAATENIRSLPDTARGEEHFCTNGVAGTLRTTDQFQSEPMIFVFDGVAKKRGRRVDIIKHNADVAVVE